MQGGSVAEVINATFNIDIEATIQRVYSTQTQLLQVCYKACYGVVSMTHTQLQSGHLPCPAQQVSGRFTLRPPVLAVVGSVNTTANAVVAAVHDGENLLSYAQVRVHVLVIGGFGCG